MPLSRSDCCAGTLEIGLLMLIFERLTCVMEWLFIRQVCQQWRTASKESRPHTLGCGAWNHPAYDLEGIAYDGYGWGAYGPRQMCAQCTRAWDLPWARTSEHARQCQLAWYDKLYEPGHCLLSGLLHASPFITQGNICCTYLIFTSLLRTSQSLISLRIVPPQDYDISRASLSRPLFDIVPSSLKHLCFHDMHKRDWLDFPKNVFLHSLDTNKITADTRKTCGQLRSIHVQQIMLIDMVHALAAAAPGLVSLGIRVSDTATCMALVAFAHLEQLCLTSGNADLIELDLRVFPCLTEAKISPLPYNQLKTPLGFVEMCAYQWLKWRKP